MQQLKAGKQIQTLLDALDRKASVPQYIHSIKELNGVLGSVEIADPNEIDIKLQA
jgi:hypothetical protein